MLCQNCHVSVIGGDICFDVPWTQEEDFDGMSVRLSAWLCKNLGTNSPISIKLGKPGRL